MPSIVSYSGLRGHIKNSHRNIDLAGDIHPATEKIEESEYYEYYLIYCKLKAKGIDIDKLLEE